MIFLVYESITWYRDRNHVPSFHIISAEILYQKSRWMEASAIPFMDTTAVQTLKALSKTYLGSNQASGLMPGFIPTGWSSQVSISKGCIIRYMEVILGDGSCNSLSLFKIIYPCRPYHIIDFSDTCLQKYVSLMQLASAEAILGGPRCDFVTFEVCWSRRFVLHRQHLWSDRTCPGWDGAWNRWQPCPMRMWLQVTKTYLK